MRDVMDDITDAIMLKHGVRGWHQDPLRKGTQHVGENRDEGWDAQDHCQGQVRQERECSNVMNKSSTAVSIIDLKLYYYQYSTSIGRSFKKV